MLGGTIFQVVPPQLQLQVPQAWVVVVVELVVVSVVVVVTQEHGVCAVSQVLAPL